jgi:osmotically-inducible protein OsmY
MATAVRTDASIHADVLAELDWDPEISARDVGVEVDEGVVTLTGTVDTFAKKLAAERAAFRIQGVRAVANEIAVKGIGVHDDTDIAKAAATALETSAVIPSDRIHVTVKNGKITLSGEIDWAYQRAAADTAVRHLTGVRGVSNRIVVKQPRVSASEVKDGIERALVRSAEVDADRIQVQAEDGHVTLTGVVRSWPEKQQAGVAAWRAQGVTQVTNEIEVRSFWAARHLGGKTARQRAGGVPARCRT